MAQMHVPILVDWDDIKDHMAKSDIVEVVRCKDCKYNYGLTHSGEFNPDDIVCTFFDTDGMQYCDFCSYAERRTDDLQ